MYCRYRGWWRVLVGLGSVEWDEEVETRRVSECKKEGREGKRRQRGR